MILSIIVNIIQVVSLLALLFSLWSMYKSYSLTQKNIMNKINHIYMLLDLFSMLTPPFIRSFYNILREKGPINPEQLSVIRNEWIANSFNELRSSLEKMCYEITDPVIKERFERMKTCMETAYTLINTLDDNSSPEFIAQINNELQALFAQINNLREEI